MDRQRTSQKLQHFELMAQVTKNKTKVSLNIIKCIHFSKVSTICFHLVHTNIQNNLATICGGKT